MTIRLVPSQFATISLAAASSIAGDTIMVDASYAGNETATIGVENLIVSAPDTVSGIVLNLASNIVKITLDGSSSITVNANGLNNVIFGNAGDNVLNGGAGQDHYYGSAGNDTYQGGGGTDFDIVDYSLEAGAGATHGIIVNQSEKIVQGGVVQDTVIDGFGDVDSIVGIRNIIGSSFSDKIYGGGKDNVLSGLGGKDYIFGNKGADTLNGGAGADKFVYQSLLDSTVASGGRDTIKDFNSGQGDKIDLHTIDANSLVGLNQTFHFIGEASSTSTAGDLRYEVVTGGVIVYGEVNGDTTPDFSIFVAKVSSLLETDFIL